MTVTYLPFSKSRSRDIIHLEDYILCEFERLVLCANARVQKGQLLKMLRTACVLFVLLFSDVFSGSTYSDNLQPFDRSIATSMAVNKTEPKVRSIKAKFHFTTQILWNCFLYRFIFFLKFVYCNCSFYDTRLQDLSVYVCKYLQFSCRYSAT